MDISIESNSVFEAVSKAIFTGSWEPSDYQKLFLHTWFCRLGPAHTDQYERLLLDLQSYFSDGTPSEFLRSLVSSHPYFLDWFGKPLVGNADAARVVASLLLDRPYAEVDRVIPDYVDEVQEYLTSLDIASKLKGIVGQPYPSPDGPIHYVISETTSHAYNVYPDIVCHFQRDNPQWYVAGYGHEVGHILTWEMCHDPDVRDLCRNEATSEFAERVAELCCKLLLDSCGIACNDVFTECDDWEDYMYEKNPGKPLFDRMISEIKLGSYSSFEDACLTILKDFQ
jgi:hypothetical protein